MNKIRTLIIFMLLSMLIPINVLAESSNFDLLFSMDGDITENKIVIAVGFDGEEAMALNQTISYDATKLTLVEVTALDNFNITKSDEVEEGKYHTLTILADSDYSFDGSKCFTLTFEVSSKFKTKKTADIFFYNAEASGPDKVKYRHTGYIMTLNRESTSEMSSSLNLIDNSTKIKYWVINHVYIFIIIGVFIILIIIFILVTPTRRKIENREIDSEDSLKHDNYTPIKKITENVQNENDNKKVADMNEAIILDESVKPFGNVTSKPEADNNIKSEAMVNGIDAFNIIPTSNASEVKKDIKEKEDAAHQGLTMINSTIFEEADTSNVNINADINFNNINNNQTVNDNNIDTLDNIPDVSNQTKQNNNNNNNGNNIMSILILLLLIVSFGYLDVVYAEDEESTYNVDNLKNYLVGNISDSSSLDYNGDGVVDILDLIETKNTVNCNFDDLYNSDPGFAELHGKSNNLISTDPNRVTTTKKGKTSKATTEKTTTEKTATTTKNSSSSSNSSNSNSSNSNTKTTTKKTTTEKTTTTKPTYNLSLSVVNGSASETSFSMTSSDTHEVTFTVNDGYQLTNSSVACDNVSYTVYSSKNTIKFKSISNNATCTITMQPKSGIKVTFNYVSGSGNSDTGVITYGSGKSKSISGAYGSTLTYELSIPDGYKVASGYPTCGTYSNGVWSATVPKESTTCVLHFEPIQYTVSVSGITSMKIYYGESRKITFTSETKYTKANCNGNSITVRGSTKTKEYYFTYKQSTTSNVTCTLS